MSVLLLSSAYEHLGHFVPKLSVCSPLDLLLLFWEGISFIYYSCVHLLIYLLVVKVHEFMDGKEETGWLYHWLFLFSFKNILNFIFIPYVLFLLFSSPDSAHILPAHNPPKSMSFLISQHKRETHASSQKKKTKILSQRLRRQKCSVSLFLRDILLFNGFFYNRYSQVLIVWSVDFLYKHIFSSSCIGWLLIVCRTIPFYAETLYLDPVKNLERKIKIKN